VQLKESKLSPLVSHVRRTQTIDLKQLSCGPRISPPPKPAPEPRRLFSWPFGEQPMSHVIPQVHNAATDIADFCFLVLIVDQSNRYELNSVLRTIYAGYWTISI
jgi:hypothetical protein